MHAWMRVLQLHRLETGAWLASMTTARDAGSQKVEATESGMPRAQRLPLDWIVLRAKHRSMRALIHMSIASLLFAACGGAQQVAVETPEASATTPDAKQPATNFSNVIAVVPVKDHAAATAWYESWIGRIADVVPMDGVAEWQIAGNGWIQVALDPEHAGSTTVVIGVKDIQSHRIACANAGIKLGDTQDHGFIKLAESVDPDGNKVVFVQEVDDQQ